LKYVMFWEFCPENLDKVIVKLMRQNKLAEEHPEDYPRIVFPTHSMGGSFKGLAIVEVEDEKQLSNMVIAYMPEMTMKFVPLIDGRKFIELYKKSKQ